MIQWWYRQPCSVGDQIRCQGSVWWNIATHIIPLKEGQHFSMNATKWEG